MRYRGIQTPLTSQNDVDNKNNLIKYAIAPTWLNASSYHKNVELTITLLQI